MTLQMINCQEFIRKDDSDSEKSTADVNVVQAGLLDKTCIKAIYHPRPTQMVRIRTIGTQAETFRKVVLSGSVVVKEDSLPTLGLETCLLLCRSD